MEETFTYEQLVELRETACKMLRIMCCHDFHIVAGHATITVERFSGISESLVRDNFVPYIMDAVERFKLHNIATDNVFDDLASRLPEHYKQLFKEHEEKHA